MQASSVKVKDLKPGMTVELFPNGASKNTVKYKVDRVVPLESGLFRAFGVNLKRKEPTKGVFTAGPDTDCILHSIEQAKPIKQAAAVAEKPAAVTAATSALVQQTKAKFGSVRPCWVPAMDRALLARAQGKSFKARDCAEDYAPTEFVSPPGTYLPEMAKRGLIKRIDPGVYVVSPDWPLPLTRTPNSLVSQKVGKPGARGSYRPRGSAPRKKPAKPGSPNLGDVINEYHFQTDSGNVMAMAVHVNGVGIVATTKPITRADFDQACQLARTLLPLR